MSDRLSRRTKIIFGSGDFGFSLTTTLVGAYFAIFLTDVAGLAPAVAAAAIFIGRTWDYVNDPLVGYLSDRTRSRWGRRRPWLLFGALPFAAVFTLMWWKPPLSGFALAAYYGAAYLIYDAGSTAVMMPYFALTPEITSDYDERTSLTSYRMFFSIAASLVAFTVPLAIVGVLPARECAEGPPERRGFRGRERHPAVPRVRHRAGEEGARGDRAAEAPRLARRQP